MHVNGNNQAESEEHAVEYTVCQRLTGLERKHIYTWPGMAFKITL